MRMTSTISYPVTLVFKIRSLDEEKKYGLAVTFAELGLLNGRLH